MDNFEDTSIDQPSALLVGRLVGLVYMNGILCNAHIYSTLSWNTSMEITKAIALSVLEMVRYPIFKIDIINLYKVQIWLVGLSRPM